MSYASNTNALKQEVVELARLVCEQAITDEQRTRLEELLTQHQELGRCYLDYVTVHAELNWRYRTRPTDPTANAPRHESASSTDARGRIGSRWMALFTLAAMVLAMVFWWTPRDSQGPQAAGTEPQRPAFVATLTNSTHAVWGTDDRAVDVGARVEVGPLRIAQGEAELVFDSGAKLLLAGPVTATVESPLSLYLERGKVAAHMPPSAIGFEVRTPTSKLVDMGTEFGVRVGDAGDTEVLVFRGQVDLYYDGEGHAGAGVKKLAMSSRQARKIEKPGTAGEAIDFSLKDFGGLARRVAEPIQWGVADGGNGHFYQLVLRDSPLTWHEAARDAMSCYFRGMPGHLVTVTSHGEDKFVVDNLLDGVNTRGVWIGLTDVLRESHFRWVTGEPYDFSHWAGWPKQQPDNFREADWHGGEDYVMYTKFPGKQPWAWNDLSIDSMHEKVSAYLVEFEPPVDALRHRSMSLDPIHWAKERGGNGHYYRMVLVEEPTDWRTIQKIASESELLGVQGRLVAMETEAERQFVAEEILRICGISQMMIGLSGSLQEDDLQWVNGQPVEGFEVERSHLPTDQVYGMFHWNPAGKWQTGWEIRAISSDVLPVGWFGYLIEYPVESQSAGADGKAS